MRLRSTSCRVLALPIALLCSGPLHAQAGGSPVPRAIAMPDTLGANFAIADSARATSGPDDLDFLVGTWHFRFQQRNADGTFGQPFTGHWFFERKRGAGAMIVDHWRRDDPNSAMDAGTWTYRTFNPQRRIWEMEGVDTGAGAWQPGLMWADATSRYVIQHYGPVIVRFRYFAIEPDRFLWRADRSTDQGRSWLLDRWTMEVTRVGR
jgi:hypothetical protein